MNIHQFLSKNFKDLLTVSAHPLMGSSKASQKDALASLGQPCTKPLISRTHVLASIVSLICLLLGILAIIPNLSIAWRLEFTGQIIVIGFLLSIMNLCLQKIIPYTFLLFEARFGQSRLQNFDAIITGKLFSSNTAWYWRIILLLFLILPLGLSIAYKRCLGGSSSAEITRSILYGIDFPMIGAWAPPNDPIYFLTTSTGAFLSASQYSDQAYPSDDQFPIAYGYNTLLLNNYSAAILDTPTAPYVSHFQRLLTADETLDIIAPIDAYLVTVDKLSDFWTNNATWQSDVESALSNGWGGLRAIDLYEGNGSHIGMMNFGSAYDQSYFGLYYNSSVTGGLALFDDPADADFELFRRSALRFNMSRTSCQGHWFLNASSIILVNGTCQVDQKLNATIFTGSQPYWVDAMPDMQHIFGSFVGVGNFRRLSNPDWFEATCSVVVATLYWSRGLFLLGGSGNNRTDWEGYSGPYSSTQQTIKSTRKTLHASRLLFLVLAIQPIITIAALATTVWLFDVPLGTDFGIISILSGFKPSESPPIVGAGLSGKLSIPVRLDVTPTNEFHLTKEDPDTITYHVRDISKSRTRSRVEKGAIYG